MIGTGLAILGAGLLGAGASIYGANKAAGAQSDAAAQAAALQQQQMRQTQHNAQPFITNGQGANNLLASFYGLNGGSPLGQNMLSAFQLSPDYQWALKGGGEALDNSAAARGGMISGNQMRAQTEFGQGLATQNLQNYFGRLVGMSGQGIQAAGTVAGANTVGANNAGNSIMAGGTADAAGILGGVKGFNSGLNSLVQYNQMNNSSYAPGNTGWLNSGSWGASNPGVSGSAFYGPATG